VNSYNNTEIVSNIISKTAVNNMILSDDDNESSSFFEIEEDPDSFEKDDDDSINRTEQWVQLVQNWMNMIEGEENITDTLEFTTVNNDMHPAEDPLAKWNLYNIFNDNLELPDFVNSFVSI